MKFISGMSNEIINFLDSKKDKCSSLKELALFFGCKPQSKEYLNLHSTLNRLESEKMIISKTTSGRNGAREIKLSGAINHV